MNAVFQFLASLVLLVSFSALSQVCWQAQTLTTTPNDDLDPRWSPDGTQIAFVGLAGR